MSSWFELNKTPDGEYNFNLKSESGETLLSSPNYYSKGNAKMDISDVQHSCGYDALYEKKSEGNQHYFELKTPKRRVLGTSQMFKSAEDRDTALAAVKSSGGTKTTKETF